MIQHRTGYIAKTGNREQMARVNRLLPVVSDDERDPWLRPVLIGGALLVGYFIWQFMR